MKSYKYTETFNLIVPFLPFKDLLILNMHLEIQQIMFETPMLAQLPPLLYVLLGSYFYSILNAGTRHSSLLPLEISKYQLFSTLVYVAKTTILK